MILVLVPDPELLYTVPLKVPVAFVAVIEIKFTTNEFALNIDTLQVPEPVI